MHLRFLSLVAIATAVAACGSADSAGSADRDPGCFEVVGHAPACGTLVSTRGQVRGGHVRDVPGVVRLSSGRPPGEKDPLLSYTLDDFDVASLPFDPQKLPTYSPDIARKFVSFNSRKGGKQPEPDREWIKNLLEHPFTITQDGSTYTVVGESGTLSFTLA